MSEVAIIIAAIVVSMNAIGAEIHGIVIVMIINVDSTVVGAGGIHGISELKVVFWIGEGVNAARCATKLNGFGTNDGSWRGQSRGQIVERALA